MFVPNFDVPLIIQKKDGGFGYDSTDLMALKYRTLVTKADWIIYVVDSGQSLHFQQLFEAGRKAGWVQKTRLDHVAFGLVQGKDKKKFKTRAGQNVRLTELLDEACERASAILRKRVENGLSNLSEEETIVQTATQLGIGGVKYFDLRQNRLSDYVFSFQQTRDFMKKLEDLLSFTLPLYAEEGKTSLTIAVGCTGGHHRSVAVTHALAGFVRQQGYQVTENHRDMSRGG